MKFSLLFFTLTIFAFARSQETKQTRVLDLSAHLAVWTTPNFDFSDADWNRLTPGLQNANEWDTSFYQRGYGSIYTSNAFQFTVFKSIPMKFFDKRKLTPLIALSGGGGTIYNASRYWDKVEISRWDTLSSHQTGTEYYIDSVVQYRYSKHYEGSIGSFSLNFLIQTNRERRFSLLTGLGFYAGIGGKSYVYYGGDTIRSTANSSSGGFYGGGYFSDANWKESVGPRFYQLGARIPYGLDFVIGNESRRFWHHCIVGIEGALEFRRTTIVDYMNFWRFSCSAAFALKYRF